MEESGDVPDTRESEHAPPQSSWLWDLLQRMNPLGGGGSDDADARRFSSDTGVYERVVLERARVVNTVLSHYVGKKPAHSLSSGPAWTGVADATVCWQTSSLNDRNKIEFSVSGVPAYVPVPRIGMVLDTLSALCAPLEEFD